MGNKITSNEVLRLLGKHIEAYVDREFPEAIERDALVTSYIMTAWRFVSKGIVGSFEDFILEMNDHKILELRERYVLQQEETKPLASFWKTIRLFIKESFEQAIALTEKSQVGIAKRFVQMSSSILGLEIEGALEGRFQPLVDRGIIDQESIDLIIKTLKASGKSGNLMITFLYMQMIFSWITQLTSGTAADYQKKMNKVFTPNHPDDAPLFVNLLLHPDSRETITDKIRESGYNETDQKIIENSYKVPLDLGSLQTLYLRNMIDYAELESLCAKLGITPDILTLMIKTWQRLPPIQDIQYMIGREAFEPDIISHYGYDKELPAEAIKWGEQNGLSKEWTEKYWYAHWNPPSIGQGYEMLWRRQIDKNELNDLFKTIETPPFWRDKLLAISYHPIGRIDLRRLNLMGVIADSELPERYEFMGYSPDDAVLMAQWTILYKKEKEKTLTRTQIEQMLTYGKISSVQASSELMELGYNAEDATRIIDLVIQKEYNKIIKDYISLFKSQYLSGQIDETQAMEQLREVGVSNIKTESLLAQWNTQFKIKTTSLSKGDIKGLIEKSIMTIGEASNFMYRLGYDRTAQYWLLRLWGKSDLRMSDIPEPMAFQVDPFRGNVTLPHFR